MRTDVSQTTNDTTIFKCKISQSGRPYFDQDVLRLHVSVEYAVAAIQNEQIQVSKVTHDEAESVKTIASVTCACDPESGTAGTCSA